MPLIASAKLVSKAADKPTWPKPIGGRNPIIIQDMFQELQPEAVGWLAYKGLTTQNKPSHLRPRFGESEHGIGAGTQTPGPKAHTYSSATIVWVESVED